MAKIEMKSIRNGHTIQDWSHGPDNLCPSDTHIAIRLSDAVKLRTSVTNFTNNKQKPISIYTAFKHTVDSRPEHSALAFKVKDHWIEMSYREYWDTCVKAAKSFIKLGLEVSSSVAIIGFNSPQWFISLLGAIFAGGVGCGIYTTNSAEACEYIIKDSHAQIIVVENEIQLKKVLEFKDKYSIKAVIMYSEEKSHSAAIMWRDFIDFGKDVDDSKLNARIKTIAPNKCASLIYTSGTTGDPKGAMISHDNIIYLSRGLAVDLVKLEFFKERFVSYLPLSHIAAQIIDIFCALQLGGTVYFAQPDALKGSLNQTLCEARPTFFFGVPRVWEKIQERIQSVFAEQKSPMKKRLITWAGKKATKNILTNFNSHSSNGLSYSMAKLLVLNKVKKTLGLDACKHFYSGAAPITKDTLQFFINLGIPLCEVYGMSELTGPHSCGVKNLNRISSVGYCMNNINESKIYDKDAEECGELCVNGRHVFMGYLNQLDKTNESINSDGYLRTGDIAKIDADGFLYITGRLKELIITAGGENIAPIPIEDSVKSELPQVISNCMLIGDKRKYLTMLITLKCKINLDNLEPLDDLTDECIRYLDKLGSSSTKVSQITDNKDEKVHTAITKAIECYNKKATSRASKVQKFVILPRDFSLFNGELGPTLKLRRPIVVKMYSKLIENMYKDANGNAE